VAGVLSATPTREEYENATVEQLREWLPEPRCVYCAAPGEWRDEVPGILSAGIDYDCGVTWDYSKASHWHTLAPTKGCIARVKDGWREETGVLLDFVQMVCDGSGIDETLRAEAKDVLTRLGKVGRHHYFPDYEAAGDCVTCGNVEDAPIHNMKEGRR
jgi:hypothetical protein